MNSGPIFKLALLAQTSSYATGCEGHTSLPLSAAYDFNLFATVKEKASDLWRGVPYIVTIIAVLWR